MTPTPHFFAILLLVGCDGRCANSQPNGDDSAVPIDTAGPDTETPDGTTWRAYYDQRLGTALATGPGAFLVLSGPSKGSEHWEDTEEAQIFLLNTTTGDLDDDSFAIIKGGWPTEDGAYYIRTRLGTEVVLPGDATGDGEPDVLLFTDSGDGDLEEPAYLFPGPVNGEVYVQDAGVLPISGPDGWDGARCGDLDENGVDELCLTSGVVFGPVGDSPEPTLTWSGSDTTSMDIAAADLDADGINELLITDPGADAMYRLTAYEPSDVELATVAETSWTAPTGESQGIVAGDDLNGDGLGDVAVAWNDGEDTIIYVLTGLGGGPLENAAASVRIPTAAMAVGDLNGDQGQDLIIGGEGSVRIFLGPMEAGSYEPRQASAHLVGAEHPDDGFGDALVTIRRNGARADELVVGAPDTTEINSSLTGGMVYLVDGIF